MMFVASTPTKSVPRERHATILERTAKRAWFAGAVQEEHPGYAQSIVVRVKRVPMDIPAKAQTPEKLVLSRRVRLICASFALTAVSVPPESASQTAETTGVRSPALIRRTVVQDIRV